MARRSLPTTAPAHDVFDRRLIEVSAPVAREDVLLQLQRQQRRSVASRDAEASLQRIGDIVRNLSDSSADLETLRQTASRSKGTLAAMKRLVAQRRTQVERSRSNQEKLHRQTKSLEHQSERLEGINTTLRLELDDLQLKLAQLSEQRQQRSDELARIEAECDRESQTAQALNVVLSRLRDEFTQVKSECEDYRGKAHAAGKTVEQLRTKLKEWKDNRVTFLGIVREEIRQV